METKTKKLSNKQLSLKKLNNEITLQKYYFIKEDAIECKFCKAHTNLWSINRHLKTNRCLTQKQLLLSMDGNSELEAGFLIYINDLKREFEQKFKEEREETEEKK